MKYSGEYWDDTTQLQYLRARWYDPSMGRFINEDTYKGDIYDNLSLNLYTYVHSNPLKYIDPSGHAKTTNYQEIEYMLNDAMKYRSDSKEYWDLRSNLGQLFQVVYGDNNNNQFKYLYGLLTQTSSYTNSQSAAEWAKNQLLNDLEIGQARWEQGVELVLFATAFLTRNSNFSASTGNIKHLSPQNLGLKHDMKTTVDNALEMAELFLGVGYTSTNKAGRFVSADGTRVVRMGDNDILGKHAGGPHMNFEILVPNPLKPGKMIVDVNYHVYLEGK